MAFFELNLVKGEKKHDHCTDTTNHHLEILVTTEVFVTMAQASSHIIRISTALEMVEWICCSFERTTTYGGGRETARACENGE